MTVTDYPDYATSQDHANKIAATGVPLNHLKTSLDTKSSQNIGAGGTLTLPSAGTFYSFTQIAYEILVRMQTVASTASRVGIQLIWSDKTSGFITKVQNISAYSGSQLNGHTITGRGPTRGDQLQIILSSPDNAVTVSVAVLESSRPWVLDHWETSLTLGLPTFPGFTSSLADPDSGWLASVNSSIAATQVNTTLMPLFSGPVKVAGATTDATAGNSEIRVQAAADVFASPPSQTLYRIANGQGESFKPGIILASALPLPAVQCELIQSNGNATTTETINANVVALDFLGG